MRLIVCRQEGGAAFMAEAYGKLTGKPGICFVTRGPGATNASIGVHTAYQDSTPMILFIGQVGSDVVEREAFQEIDYRRMFGQMAKWVAQIDRADRIPGIRESCFSPRCLRPARAGRAVTSGRHAVSQAVAAETRPYQRVKAACRPADMDRLARNARTGTKAARHRWEEGDWSARRLRRTSLLSRRTNLPASCSSSAPGSAGQPASQLRAGKSASASAPRLKNVYAKPT